jgi:hypothetical protein
MSSDFIHQMQSVAHRNISNRDSQRNFADHNSSASAAHEMKINSNNTSASRQAIDALYNKHISSNNSTPKKSPTPQRSGASTPGNNSNNIAAAPANPTITTPPVSSNCFVQSLVNLFLNYFQSVDAVNLIDNSISINKLVDSLQGIPVQYTEELQLDKQSNTSRLDLQLVTEWLIDLPTTSLCSIFIHIFNQTQQQYIHNNSASTARAKFDLFAECNQLVHGLPIVFSIWKHHGAKNPNSKLDIEGIHRVLELFRLNGREVIESNSILLLLYEEENAALTFEQFLLFWIQSGAAKHYARINDNSTASNSCPPSLYVTLYHIYMYFKQTVENWRGDIDSSNLNDFTELFEFPEELAQRFLSSLNENCIDSWPQLVKFLCNNSIQEEIISIVHENKGVELFNQSYKYHRDNLLSKFSQFYPTTLKQLANSNFETHNLVQSAVDKSKTHSAGAFSQYLLVLLVLREAESLVENSSSVMRLAHFSQVLLHKYPHVVTNATAKSKAANKPPSAAPPSNSSPTTAANPIGQNSKTHGNKINHDLADEEEHEKEEESTNQLHTNQLRFDPTRSPSRSALPSSASTPLGTPRMKSPATTAPASPTSRPMQRTLGGGRKGPVAHVNSAENSYLLSPKARSLAVSYPGKTENNSAPIAALAIAAIEKGVLTAQSVGNNPLAHSVVPSASQLSAQFSSLKRENLLREYVKIQPGRTEEKFQSKVGSYIKQELPLPPFLSVPHQIQQAENNAKENKRDEDQEIDMAAGTKRRINLGELPSVSSSFELLTDTLSPKEFAILSELPLAFAVEPPKSKGTPRARRSNSNAASKATQPFIVKWRREESMLNNHHTDVADWTKVGDRSPPPASNLSNPAQSPTSHTRSSSSTSSHGHSRHYSRSSLGSSGSIKLDRSLLAELRHKNKQIPRQESIRSLPKQPKYEKVFGKSPKYRENPFSSPAEELQQPEATAASDILVINGEEAELIPENEAAEDSDNSPSETSPPRRKKKSKKGKKKKKRSKSPNRSRSQNRARSRSNSPRTPRSASETRNSASEPPAFITSMNSPSKRAASAPRSALRRGPVYNSVAFPANGRFAHSNTPTNRLNTPKSVVIVSPREGRSGRAANSALSARPKTPANLAHRRVSSSESASSSSSDSSGSDSEEEAYTEEKEREYQRSHSGELFSPHSTSQRARLSREEFRSMKALGAQRAQHSMTDDRWPSNFKTNRRRTVARDLTKPEIVQKQWEEEQTVQSGFVFSLLPSATVRNSVEPPNSTPGKANKAPEVINVPSSAVKSVAVNPAAIPVANTPVPANSGYSSAANSSVKLRVNPAALAATPAAPPSRLNGAAGSVYANSSTGEYRAEPRDEALRALAMVKKAQQGNININLYSSALSSVATPMKMSKPVKPVEAGEEEAGALKAPVSPRIIITPPEPVAVPVPIPARGPFYDPSVFKSVIIEEESAAANIASSPSTIVLNSQPIPLKGKRRNIILSQEAENTIATAGASSPLSVQTDLANLESPASPSPSHFASSPRRSSLKHSSIDISNTAAAAEIHESLSAQKRVSWKDGQRNPE